LSNNTESFTQTFAEKLKWLWGKEQEDAFKKIIVIRVKSWY
jgi:hypothetical protein